MSRILVNSKVDDKLAKLFRKTVDAKEINLCHGVETAMLQYIRKHKPRSKQVTKR